MGTDEIRAILADARRACDGAQAPASAHMTPAVRESLMDTLCRLTEAAELLLAERDAFTGRLRRSVQAPPPPAQDPPLLEGSSTTPQKLHN